MTHPFLTPRSLVLFIVCCVTVSLSAQETYDKKVSAKDINAALLALEGFATAETWEEAAKFVGDAEHLQAQMAAHYAKYPWEKINIVAVPNESANRFDGEVVYKVVFFDLVVEGFDRILPISLTEFNGEFKVDWEPFVQKYSFTFENFMKDKASAPQQFMLTLQRGVAMDDEVALGLDGGVIKVRAKYRNFDVDIDGLRVDFIENVFCSENSEIAKQVKDGVPWTDFDGPYRVKLRWNNAGGKDYMELVELYKVDLNTPSMFPPKSS